MGEYESYLQNYKMGGLQMKCIKNIITVEKMGDDMTGTFRIIGWCDKIGLNEGLIFTQEFDADVYDFIPPKMELLYDEVKDVDLPDLFPREFCLQKL